MRAFHPQRTVSTPGVCTVQISEPQFQQVVIHNA